MFDFWKLPAWAELLIIFIACAVFGVALAAIWQAIA